MRPSVMRRQVFSTGYLSVDDVLALDGLVVPPALDGPGRVPAPAPVPHPEHPSLWVPLSRWDIVAAATRACMEAT